MRVLILPGSNALSHLAKGLAVREALRARGAEVVFAASAARSPFLTRLDVPHRVLPDLQEADGGSAPTFAWFRHPDRFLRVVQAETALLAEVKPDLVLGIFRFTAPTSAALAGIPCDTLACGCMLPAFRGVLGFAPGEPGHEAQRPFLDTFYSHCGARASRALAALGRPAVEDVRSLLLGRRTYLWDTPDFQPLAPAPGLEHVGPLAWDRWPGTEAAGPALDRLGSPLAVLSLGTAIGPDAAPGRILDRLLALGFQVALAGGGFPSGRAPRPGVTAFGFAPMGDLLARADLLVCHGGQQTVFEALAAGVPTAVFPFHPEQAQNGLCLERLGAGARLVPPTVFWGSSRVYADALAALGDAELDARLMGLPRRGPLPLPVPLARAADRVAERLGA
ncbi:glycosyltransferase [Mesoterricola sediminis]|uniref:PGL/p-HBAD biosynthesis glycosyltransferase n=1 Tax=Mesoterricola sediminis TaxID=2927980 RepID=A0AA48GT35_9BACT|nr:glycosyltransferase [Mesoterricola sediminis]BDU75689.1 PGL/p-HBAD biosynthesis glycosyltransferase [Mesoterricola sediminis]